MLEHTKEKLVSNSDIASWDKWGAWCMLKTHQMSWWHEHDSHDYLTSYSLRLVERRDGNGHFHAFLWAMLPSTHISKTFWNDRTASSELVVWLSILRHLKMWVCKIRIDNKSTLYCHDYVSRHQTGCGNMLLHSSFLSAQASPTVWTSWCDAKHLAARYP